MLRLASSLSRASADAPRSPLAARPSAVDRAVAAHDAAPYSETGRALDGFALRGERPALEAPSPPAPGSDWTLAETIAEAERRGAKLVVASSGIKVRHAHRLPDLARNAARHARALTVWLHLRGERVPPPFDAPAWDGAVRLHAAWFALGFEAPPVPFPLRPGETCVDASLLRAGIAGRLAAGPLAPSADRLRGELAALFARFAPEAQTEPVTVPQRRAA